MTSTKRASRISDGSATARVPAWRLAAAAALAVALCVPAARALGQGPSPAPAAPAEPQDLPPAGVRITEIVIDRFTTLDWQPETGSFRSPGPVRVTMRDAVSGETVVLEADDAEARPQLDAEGRPTGKTALLVKGNLKLTREGSVLTGTGLSFDPVTQTGRVNQARGLLQGLGYTLDVSAEQLDLAPDARKAGRQVVTVTRSAFTTCTHERPDYKITARRATIGSDGRVDARDITFYLGGVRIISLPWFQRTFGRTVRNPIPLPTYNKSAGLQMRFANEVPAGPRAAVNYDIQVALLRAPRGTIDYERELGPAAADSDAPRTRAQAVADAAVSTLQAAPVLSRVQDNTWAGPRRVSLYGMVSSRTYVYNRTRGDLQVSRLPEVGVAAVNVLDRPVPTELDAGTLPLTGAQFLDPRLWTVGAGATAGYYREAPTGAEAGRVSLRADMAGPLFRLTGPLYARYGASAWVNAYTGGDTYVLLAPEVEGGLLIGRSIMVGAAFRYQSAAGSTPFVFDRRDVRNEMRLMYGFLGGRWGYDLNVSYDLDRRRAYDTLFSVRRRFDCMEVGVAYATRSQTFNLLLNLLPSEPRRARP